MASEQQQQPMMGAEIQEAVDFLVSFLYGNIPRRKVVLFAEQLANFLLDRFSGLKWDPANPNIDTAPRLLQVCDAGHADQLVSVAAEAVGLQVAELLAHLPSTLRIFIKPGHVAAAIGADPTPQTLTDIARSAHPNDVATARLRLTAAPNPSANTFLASHTGGTNSAAPVFEAGAVSDLKFTVASFATTRFGTSKQKSSLAALRSIQTKVSGAANDDPIHRTLPNLFHNNLLPPPPLHHSHHASQQHNADAGRGFVWNPAPPLDSFNAHHPPY